MSINFSIYFQFFFVYFFNKIGITSLDSLHLAMAEYSKADILLTVDDKFIQLSTKTNAKVKIMNPVNWIMEVLKK